MTSDEHTSYSYAFTADPGKPLREARETITKLTEENEMLNGIIKGLRQMLADAEPEMNAARERLRERDEMVGHLCDAATMFRTERDEARRWYCNEMSDRIEPYRSPEQFANDKNWNCFAGGGK